MNQIKEQLTKQMAELPLGHTPEIHRRKKLGDKTPLQQLYEAVGRSDKTAGAMIGMSPTGFGNARKGSKPTTKVVEIATRGVLSQMNMPAEERQADIVALVRIPPEHENTITALFTALGIKWGSV